MSLRDSWKIDSAPQPGIYDDDSKTVKFVGDETSCDFACDSPSGHEYECRPHSPGRSTFGFGSPIPSLSPRPIETHQRAPNKRPPVLRFWRKEISLLVLGISLVVTIFIILLQQNGRPSSAWSLPIGLNTITAALSTVLCAVLLRNLGRDNSPADRDAAQSIDIACCAGRHRVVRRRTVVQQSIQTAEHEFAVGDPDEVQASLPVSTYVNGSYGGNRYFADVPSLPPRFRGEMACTLASVGNDAFDISSACACLTGNCSFPSIESLGDVEPGQDVATHATVGLCSTCFDVSLRIWPASGWPLPGWNGQGMLSISADSYDLSWAEGAIDGLDLNKPEYRWAFANVTVLSMTLGENATSPSENQIPGKHVAVSLLAVPVSPHLLGLHPQRGPLGNAAAADADGVADGVGVEDSIPWLDVIPKSIHDFDAQLGRALPMDSRWLLTAIQSPCRVNDTTVYTMANMSDVPNGVPLRLVGSDSREEGVLVSDLRMTTAPASCVFRFRISAFAVPMSEFFRRELFNGSCAWDPSMGPYIDCGEAWWLAQFWEQKNATFASILDRFAAFATAVTNSFRLGTGRAPGTTDRVFGTAYRTVPVTVIKWRWLLFPAVLLTVEAGVLGYMITKSWRAAPRREMVWKSSILPLLYYRDLFFDDGDGGGGGPRLMTTTEMELDAKGVQVAFIGVPTQSLGAGLDVDLRRRRTA
ncbi:hypothetical protein B0H66DRAFT_603684 [Apodospora peruviana]|uniref:Uncharacterized protein n=1 Tax=Apodospora peruviana TaxID=516989 RepID=A0AAE0M4N1_9PEZI|nr:hypothetical protein B0H66DRAFT_603684 [Apodospora peruviana]